jgi:chromosome segregation ATPase
MEPIIDPPKASGILSSMLTRIVKHAMRETIQELIKPDLDKLNERMDKLDGRMDKLDGRMDKFDGRMDKFDDRMDKLQQRLDDGIARLDQRIDALTKQQIQITGQQLRLIEQVSALKTGFEINATLAHRIDRLEDRIFAKAS